jgi:predicted DNA-binding protein (MmcQ/YjbR family)
MMDAKIAAAAHPARNPQTPTMNRSQLEAFCRGFPGAVETLHGEPYNFLVYTIGGVKFAYFKTSEPERWRFSVRVAPDRFVELTDVPGVKPARWRRRYHWITVVKVRQFPADYLGELVAWSYRKALHSLSRKRQAALTGAA